MKVQRNVAVVIGVGGMGQAIARRVGSGRRLLLADFSASTMHAAAGQLRDEGHDVTTQGIDVADAQSVRSLAEVAKSLGPVTHVVHTAGLSPTQAPAAAILRVDLLGVALVLDAFVGVVADGAVGLIVSSAAGHVREVLSPEQETALATTPTDQLLGLPFLAPDAVTDSGYAYMISKRGNLLRVQAAAVAWGRRGARVNSLSPGTISTPMAQQELAGPHGDHMRAGIAGSPAARLGTPDDIAAGAAFLLSPEAAYITGTDLLIDGGGTAAERWRNASDLPDSESDGD